METAKLKKFAQLARCMLLEQVTTKVSLVLDLNSAAQRESAVAIKKLEEAIKDHGKEQIIERVAYIWFNRFCALRFMDVNRYTRVGVVSPTAEQFQPEILAEAKMGHLNEEMVNDKVRQQVFSLLEGKVPSRDPQGEAYHLLVVAACNYWNKTMPFLFEYIDDYTELLMPDDLLSGKSILAFIREVMTLDTCKDVEVIGWLYQFYISEKKDQVFEGLKRNKKIAPENIPAATQLFTPHWIVRYLVENSLGRLWMLNRPSSKLIEQMDYYIKPEQPEQQFLRINKPEDIKICDPACGSGHMLTYAFDLLHAIYEEEGYEPAEIPEMILTYNLYGIEIDERAGGLAAFALTMKARAKQPRFFRKPAQPNICVLENIQFDKDELDNYMDIIGRDFFTAPLQATLRQFEEADNFGSLIRTDVTDVDSMLRILESKNFSGDLFLNITHQKMQQVLRQAQYLESRYHVVIANPPYMGSRGMNKRLSSWTKDNYPESNSDLFSMFMIRCLELCIQNSYMGMINLPSWLFLSSFEKLRQHVLNNYTIETLLHMGRGIFGIDWGSTAFTIKKAKDNNIEGIYFRLHKRNFQYIHYQDIAKLFLNAKRNPKYKYNFDLYGEDSELNEIKDESDDNGLKLFYHSSSMKFKMIPGSPIAYWVSKNITNAFKEHPKLENVAPTRKGMVTARNEIYVRGWFEVSMDKAGLDKYKSRTQAQKSDLKWFSYLKGGGFRKWYGNKYDVVNWKNDGEQLQTTRHHTEDRVWATNFNLEYIFKPNVNWGAITSIDFSARISNGGELFDAGGSACFPDRISREAVLGFLNAKVSRALLGTLNPTLNFQSGNIANLPLLESVDTHVTRESIHKLIKAYELDWNSYETSWDFTSLPLLNPEYRQLTLKATYQNLYTLWQVTISEMRRLEEENNRIFIETYNLQDELTPDVPLNEITLTCNPHYRYGGDKNEEELEDLLLSDTIRELISYAVGCMFGRYSLEKPGLILANQGESIEDYLKQIPEPSFTADKENVIPILDGNWFTDDITERFHQFLRVTFGAEHYEENLKFVEQALSKNGKTRDISDYFLKDFYTDHLKRYKKRPIYWLFSSPKGSFNALIYMHRYRPDTVSMVLNNYLREFRAKLTSHKNHLEVVSISASASQSEKTKALKEIEKISKMIVELEEYEREILYPLATKLIDIDLDDGVKVNYLKFGVALKKITGLDTAED